jgi:hypothetical protein
MKTMHKRMMGLAFCIAAFALSAAAQNTFPASGNVGIGTTTPRGLLDVGPYGGTNQGIREGYYLEMNMLANYNAASYLSFNAVQNGTGTFVPVYAPGQGIIMTQSGGGQGSIDFLSHNWNGIATPVSISAFTEIMHLDQSGNVGIGTTAPLTKFHVNNGTNRDLLIGSDASQLGTSGMFLGSFNDGATAYAPLSIIGSQILLYGGLVGIGTTAPTYNLDVTGKIRATTGFVFPDGSTQLTAFNPTICGGDYAESVDVAGTRASYEPGDVLVIDPKTPGKFLKANLAYSTLVAGIYSTKPGTVGRRQTAAKSPDEVPMAVVGIVPTKVSAENGPIHAGDLLVASSTLGRAMKGTDRGKMLGAVVGKALGNLDSGTGVIEVLVTLQ